MEQLPTHCQACGNEYVSEDNHKRLTTHHVYPQRYFHGKGPKEYVCQNCHTELDKYWIPLKPKLTKPKYKKLFNQFIEHKQREVK